MRRSTRNGIAALLAAGALITASACGSSGSDETSSGSKPAGDPLTIGFFDPSAGAYKSPGVGVGARAATDYVNSELGGIHNRPVKLVSCATDGTPETTISCANKFAEDKVVAALDGFNTTSSAAIDILTTAGIPLIGGIPFDSATGAKAENRVFFSAPQAAFLIGALQAFGEQGKKSVTLVAADIPATHQSIDLILKPVGKALGLDVNGLYYSVTNPNFNAIAATIKDDDPDVGGLLAAPDPSVCTKLVQGLRQLGYGGTIFTAACTEFIKQAPKEAEGAALYSSHWLPQAAEFAPAETQKELKTAEKAVKNEGGTADFYAYAQFGVTVTLAQALNASPDAALDGPTILSTLKALHGFKSFLGPELTCGKATSPNCTTQMLLFEVNDKGAAKPVTDGWIDPLPDVLATIPGAA